MKRYMLFSGDNFNRQGGIGDLAGFFQSEEHAMEELPEHPNEWFQLFDSEIGKVVRDGGILSDRQKKHREVQSDGT